MVVRHRKEGSTARRRGALVATLATAIGLVAPAAASAAPPTVTATWAAEVSASSFRARGLLETGNLNTTYHFDYIPLSAYEANLHVGADGFQGALTAPLATEAKVLAATEPVEVGQRIGGLNPETAYRYRLVAKNGAGETDGPGRTVITQEASPPLGLAENRGWELVSPVDKNGGGIAEPETLFGGGVVQAAAQGGAVTYSSASSFAGGVGAPGASQYLSVRGDGGWSTANVTLPTHAGAFGDEPDGVPYRVFSADLGRAIALEEPHVFQQLALEPMPRVLNSIATPDLRLAGVTEDLQYSVFATCAALTPDATEEPGSGGCDPAYPNLYLAQGGTLRLINLEPEDSTGTPKAALAAQIGAVSNDGSRIYWVDRNGALILRNGNRSLLVDAEGTFQAASTDGGVAYYTKGSHLYRYSVSAESSVDITPGGGVTGVLGASASGDYVYYLDASGVQVWHGGTTSPVAAAADPSNYPPATGTARVSADGTNLVFLSTVPLTGFDPEGATEVYRYNATANSLLCVSCNPTGARPLGSASIPGAQANGTEVAVYKPRVMDSAGDRVFFDSEDALVPNDGNGERDVYEWRADGVGGCPKPAGCLGLISSGKGAESSTFLDASADGTDVFFLAPDSLVATDPGSIDLYDARIGGGFPPPPSPIPCIGDACQPLPPEPDDPTPGTLFYGSEGNPNLQIEGLTKKKRKHHRKHHKKRKGGRNHHHPRHHQRRAAR